MTDGWGPQGYGGQDRHRQHQPQPQPPAGPYGWPQPAAQPPVQPLPMQPPVQPPLVRRSGSVVPLVLAVGVAVAGVALLVAGLLSSAAGVADYRTMRVSSRSMEPTYPRGSDVTVKRVDGSTVGHGDVVLFNARGWGIDGLIMERVIGVGGDHVVIDKAGTIRVNGTTLREPYVYRPDGPSYGLPLEVTVPAGRLFLLGDHRSQAADSRAHLDVNHGTVARSMVVGKVVDHVSTGAPDHGLLWAGGATAVVGVVGAVVAGVVRYRRTRYVPRV